MERESETEKEKDEEDERRKKKEKVRRGTSHDKALKKDELCFFVKRKERGRGNVLFVSQRERERD